MRLGVLAVFFMFGASSVQAAPLRRMLGQYPLPNLGEDERFQTGSLGIGNFFSNENRAMGARPDGSGTAYNVYQVNVHDAAKGGKAGVIADALFLSDRLRPNNFNFTQFGYLLGMVFRGDAGRLQFNREEQRPLDRGGRIYSYWDARASFDFDTGGADTGAAARLARPTFPGRNQRRRIFERFRGVLTAGWFLHNNGYPSRPDLSGEAKLRYHGKGEITLVNGVLLLGEAGFYTDKHRSLHPVSMESSVGLGWGAPKARVAVERVISSNLYRPGHHVAYLLTLTHPFDSRR